MKILGKVVAIKQFPLYGDPHSPPTLVWAAVMETEYGTAYAQLTEHGRSRVSVGMEGMINTGYLSAELRKA